MREFCSEDPQCHLVALREVTQAWVTTKLIDSFAHASLFVFLRFLRGLFLFCRHGRRFLGLFVALSFFTHGFFPCLIVTTVQENTRSYRKLLSGRRRIFEPDQTMRPEYTLRRLLAITVLLLRRTNRQSRLDGERSAAARRERIGLSRSESIEPSTERLDS